MVRSPELSDCTKIFASSQLPEVLELNSTVSPSGSNCAPSSRPDCGGYHQRRCAPDGRHAVDAFGLAEQDPAVGPPVSAIEIVAHVCNRRRGSTADGDAHQPAGCDIKIRNRLSVGREERMGEGFFRARNKPRLQLVHRAEVEAV